MSDAIPFDVRPTCSGKQRQRAAFGEGKGLRSFGSELPGKLPVFLEDSHPLRKQAPDGGRSRHAGPQHGKELHDTKQCGTVRYETVHCAAVFRTKIPHVYGFDGSTPS